MTDLRQRFTTGCQRLSGGIVAVGCTAMLAAAAVAAAVGPRVWSQSGYGDFVAGTPESVSIASSGEVRLAPQTERLWNAADAQVWSVAAAAGGTVFVAAGTDGEVFRLRPGTEEPEVMFAAEQLDVQAVAMAPDGDLFVATSPRGALFKVPPDHQGEQLPSFFFPRQTYIWDVAVAEDGTVFLGTGDDGTIFRVGADGEGEPLFDSGETHITALALDRRGNLIAGSSSSGHVYRVSPEGDVFVLFDSPYREITDVVVNGTGIWVSALGRTSGSESGQAGGSGGAASAARRPAVAGGGEGDGSDAGGGAVYLIHDDGLVEQLWSDDTDGVHSLVGMGDGVLAGSGPEGRLIHVEPGGRSVLLLDLEASQVTALAGAAGDGVLVGTSNGGSVLRVGSGFRMTGEYLSTVKDAGTTSTWGTVRWRAGVPAGTSVHLWTRSGNTDSPDDTWSGWQGPYGDAEGTPITSPPARFVQWKAELATEAPQRTPTLEGVELVYVQRNLRPQVTELEVHPAGVVYRQSGGMEDGLPFAQLPGAVREALAEQEGPGSSASQATAFMGRPLFMPGLRTFSWNASDPNGDDLAYTVEYRGEEESAWKKLVQDAPETMYVWDTTAIPDGLYRLRVSAVDAPSNPEGQALRGDRVSQPFVVDNTPPRVEGLEAIRTDDGFRISGRVADDVSLIRRIDYAVDGTEWRVVLPADALADSRVEDVGFRIAGLDPGEHTIVVRATDLALNSGSARVVVVVR